ncbi:hypothetical protein FLA105534_04088 [Flavobacterium bizetiae]|uniref:ABM domain-containing protein n=1 Tax=Flavobacterium bizetiae TaxID=2704140 RepID=A0A6J4GW90_9FLAO|nr:hypothetical protein [Flavobacterium bizetiae]CAA9202434.1 hypothetical protein FLA105534_04088 [Flavobacterium bizetiae]CAD5344750.1 hypothetical protein FLA105535_04758 [Flavobacterium bizetiae]CAD5350743.1 hypothetical protein FLA105534_04738 [Flavobacterium bizetiae]
MKNQAIELTTFKLNNCTIQQFITANKEVDEFLKQQKGFVSRSIFELKKNIVHDLLIWENAEDGTNAMHKLMHELSNSAVHDLIDQSTVSWNIAPIEHFVNLEK